ncbi:hypothetical protein SUGI_0510480 [Cryptomeria japonica]|uniref:TORTIFOLIA1-like protein 2 n=1 Tax=Cryptomeria japonica TaxID=3369 RepID=UPI002408B3FA|nr:TORTIFOLIA1-like protein 2 [Cryptomeria japonica]GLJ26447.1 hypothetical protein SUGI_0510480 [Cryptomeria japonica]
MKCDRVVMAPARAKRNASPQQASLELKQRVIQVLNKLADRDTYQIASQHLGKIAETLSPEGLGPFLSCIFETDSQHKSIVRRECVKVFATVAASHGELLLPFLPKMVGNIIRRLKDPDSNVRDACVDVIGVLASKILHSFSVLVKPLCEALAEQNRQLQVGSALCLATAIDNAHEPPLPTLQKILPRIIKLLTSHAFLANAALLTVIGSIVQAGGASSQQTLAVLIPCMVDTLQSKDWATRKAAAEAFGRVALRLGPLLSSFKASCVAALESSRFDKVKPVRDTVVQTLQIWKSIPDAEISSPLTAKGSTTKEKLSKEPFSTDIKSGSRARLQSTFLRKKGSAVTKSAIDCISTAKKRTITGSKINQSLPRKLDCKQTDDWHVEVAIPRNCLPMSVIRNEEFNNSNFSDVSGENARPSNTDDTYRFGDSETFGKMGTPRLSDESRASCETKCILVDDAFEGKSSIHKTPSSNLTSELTSLHSHPLDKNNMDKQHSDSLVSESNTGHSTNFAGEATSRTAEDLAFIRKHLSQIENQQLSLMELLQVFMGSTSDSISALETRLNGLEKIVDEIAQDLANSPGRIGSGDKCRRSLNADMLRSKFWKRNERTYPSSRHGSSDTIPSIHKFGREALHKSDFTSTDSQENSIYGSLQRTFMVKPLVDAWDISYRGDVDSFPDSVVRDMPEKVKANQLLPRALDRTTWKENFANDSLARGNWLASMNKFSLSGTCFTAKDTQTEVTDVGSSRIKLSGNVNFWSVWTRAVDYICAKDIDAAFVEVLHSEDDLLLIQLMKRTGPVLGNLSQVTTLEILQTVLRLLLDQKFLDTIIPWLQQMVDLIYSNGSDYFGLSHEEKMETLCVLQEASSIQFSDLSSWSSVVQIASMLTNAWTSDLRSMHTQK